MELFNDPTALIDQFEKMHLCTKPAINRIRCTREYLLSHKDGCNNCRLCIGYRNDRNGSNRNENSNRNDPIEMCPSCRSHLDKFLLFLTLMRRINRALDCTYFQVSDSISTSTSTHEGGECGGAINIPNACSVLDHLVETLTQVMQHIRTKKEEGSGANPADPVMQLLEPGWSVFKPSGQFSNRVWKDFRKMGVRTLWCNAEIPTNEFPIRAQGEWPEEVFMNLFDQLPYADYLRPYFRYGHERVEYE